MHGENKQNQGQGEYCLGRVREEGQRTLRIFEVVYLIYILNEVRPLWMIVLPKENDYLTKTPVPYVRRHLLSSWQVESRQVEFIPIALAASQNLRVSSYC